MESRGEAPAARRVVALPSARTSRGEREDSSVSVCPASPLSARKPCVFPEGSVGGSGQAALPAAERPGWRAPEPGAALRGRGAPLSVQASPQVFSSAPEGAAAQLGVPERFCSA